MVSKQKKNIFSLMKAAMENKHFFPEICSWVPINDLPVVRKALTDGSNAVGSTIQSFLNLIPTNENPPTFNRTNRFTRGFQVKNKQKKSFSKISKQKID